MNATVNASLKKRAVKKPAASARTKAQAKTVGASKKASSSTKSATIGSDKSAAKAAEKSATKKAAAPKKPAKTAIGPKTAAAVNKPDASRTAAPVRSATAKQTARPAKNADTQKRSVRPIQSGTLMTSNKTSVVSTDKIEQPEVLKVSEVATKTSKSTPASSTDGSLLTEEQILQMSEKDYMNEAQLAFFKARLQQLERDLLKNAGETTEHLRETVLVPDPADRATIEEEHALELRTRDRERKLLKKVQQSIAAIESGDYGWCEETGEPIGIPRLLARPTATLSLEAQQRRELKQKLYGD